MSPAARHPRLAARRVLRWLPALALLLCLVGAAVGIVRHARRTVWCRYTDDVTIREDASVAYPPRLVLWEDPHPSFGGSNVPSEVHEAAFAPDDATMVFTRGQVSQTNADLYVCSWDGRRWSVPTPLAGLNTPAHEVGPSFSRDGRYLFFASDREGGLGGYDLWVARWDGARWGAVTNLGPAVNSPANELGPAPWPDGTALLFSSDRPFADAAEREAFRRQHKADPPDGRHDLFMATIARDPAPASTGTNTPAVAASPGAPPPVPAFVAAARRIVELNSPDDDRDPEPTPRGDFVYFASNRKAGAGGYDLYRARSLARRFEAPRPLGLEVNRPADDLAPALRMEGFDLAFSSNRDAPAGALHLLYAATAREVLEGLDLSRWHCLTAILNRIKWWILLAIGATVALVYLIRHFRDMTSLYHRCLLGSVIAHVLALLAAAFWFISQEIAESARPKAMEVSIDANALAREKLALQMQEKVEQLRPADLNVIVQEKEALPVPEFKPPTPVKPMPLVARSADETFVTRVEPSKEMDAQQSRIVSELRKQPAPAMPELELPKLDITLDVRDVKTTEAPQEVAKAEPLFEPAIVQQKLTVKPQDLGRPPDRPVGDVAKADDVSVDLVTNRVADASRILKTGLTLAVASVGRETAGPKPELTGARNLFPALTEKEGTGEALAMATPNALDVPTGFVSAEGAGDAQPELAGYQDGVAVAQARMRNPGGRPALVQLGVADVDAAGVKTADTGGKHVVASAGIQGGGQLPALNGMGDIATLLARGPGRGKEYRLDAPGALDVPASFGDTISPNVFKNPGTMSIAAVESLGGSAETQNTISRGLDWFTQHQEPDGRWDIKKHGGQAGHDVAATALPLLCYYGWGAKHTQPGPYQTAVAKALDWLIGVQGKDGNLMGPARPQNGMYSHCMGTIALCEAYGLTKDPRLLEPARKALAFLMEAQDPVSGGWRYQPRQSGDTSVFGWAYMALKSAELAGLEVRESVLKGAHGWLDRVGGGKQGGIYGYQSGESSRPAMIATGMFCRQLAKVPPTDPRMIESAMFLAGHPLDAKALNFYYLYYGTLCLYQHQGETWEKWNESMKSILLALQHKTGDEAGSWTPTSAGHGEGMGRVIATAMATLSLEVYYRILPIYGFPTAKSETPAAPAEQPKQP